MNQHSQIENLISQIKKYNYQYYTENQSEISDETFDNLNLELQMLLKDNPNFKFNDKDLLGSTPAQKFSKHKSHKYKPHGKKLLVLMKIKW